MTELNSVLNYLRFEKVSTTAFHDTQDLFVDYLYNGSPPLILLTERSPMSISKDLQKRSRKSSPNKSAISKNVPGKDATKQAGATATTSNFVLKREHIRLPVEGLSGLSKMFKSGGGGVETNGLRLLIYLPNRLPMNLQVSRSATVEQTIEKVLKLHKNANNSANNVEVVSSMVLIPMRPLY